MNKDILKSVLNERKAFLPLKDVKFVTVPHFDELAVRNLYPKFAADAKFMRYFADELPRGKFPDRNYFFNVFNTLYEDRLQAMIAHANKQRFAVAECGIVEDTVVVSDEW